MSPGGCEDLRGAVSLPGAGRAVTVGGAAPRALGEGAPPGLGSEGRLPRGPGHLPVPVLEPLDISGRRPPGMLGSVGLPPHIPTTAQGPAPAPCKRQTPVAGQRRVPTAQPAVPRPTRVKLRWGPGACTAPRLAPSPGAPAPPAVLPLETPGPPPSRGLGSGPVPPAPPGDRLGAPLGCWCCCIRPVGPAGGRGAGLSQSGRPRAGAPSPSLWAVPQGPLKRQPPPGTLLYPVRGQHRGTSRRHRPRGSRGRPRPRQHSLSGTSGGHGASRGFYLAQAGAVSWFTGTCVLEQNGEGGRDRLGLSGRWLLGSVT